VFLALLLIYVGIMAYKLVKIQRDVVEINELADRRAGAGTDDREPAREETPA
jgi:hypothetical protein